MRVGSVGEGIATNKLMALGFGVEKGDGKKRDIVVEIKGQKYDCEIKFDVYANSSGNIAIEFYNTKLCKPSGIDSTNCHFWIQVLNEKEIYIAEVTKIKEFIKDNNPKRTIINAGDGNASLYLYEKSIILEKCFQKLDEKYFAGH